MDAATYCDWGVDFVKIDHCGTGAPNVDGPNRMNESWMRFRQGFDQEPLPAKRPLPNRAIETSGKGSVRPLRPHDLVEEFLIGLRERHAVQNDDAILDRDPVACEANHPPNAALNKDDIAAPGRVPRGGRGENHITGQENRLHAEAANPVEIDKSPDKDNRNGRSGKPKAKAASAAAIVRTKITMTCPERSR